MATTGTEKSDVEITTWSVQEPNAAHSGLCGERCKKFVHTAVVAIMILIVWGLIIVSAVSSYIPRDYKVYACGISLHDIAHTSTN